MTANGAACNDASNVAQAGLLKPGIDNLVEAHSQAPTTFQQGHAAPSLTLADIDHLTHGRLGTHDVPCPLCGPSRRAPGNRRRPVLRVWRIERGFASFHCARCGESGYTRDRSARRPDPAAIERARAEAIDRERAARAERLSRARWLWSQRQPIAGTIAANYLREARGFHGPLPTTLGFLPTRGGHRAAMIGAFGPATRSEPGGPVIDDADVLGVHITRLKADGSDKAGTETDKIMIGRSLGVPLVLAPFSDLLGLAVTEGVEDALSVHEVTGLAVWAAGAADRMPALAAAVPDFTECVTIFAHPDEAGQRGARALAEVLYCRKIEVFIEGLKA